MRKAGFSPKSLPSRAPQPDFQWEEQPNGQPPAKTTPPGKATYSSTSAAPSASHSRSEEAASTSHAPSEEPYWRRQYIFAAATMPAGEAGKSVGATLKRMVPGAVWLNGRALHRAQALVTHHWVPVTEDAWAAALQVQSHGYGKGCSCHEVSWIWEGCIYHEGLHGVRRA